MMLHGAKQLRFIIDLGQTGSRNRKLSFKFEIEWLNFSLQSKSRNELLSHVLAAQAPVNSTLVVHSEPFFF